MRCLIVEDDASPRLLMEMLLARAGHRVRSTGDLAGAREALLESAVDVVLLDLELPDGGGAEAVATIRGGAPQSRILVVSGHSDPRHVLAAIEAGADGYLVKDDLSSELGRALQAVRAGHSPLSPQVAAVAVRRLQQKSAARPIASVAPAKSATGGAGPTPSGLPDPTKVG